MAVHQKVGPSTLRLDLLVRLAFDREGVAERGLVVFAVHVRGSFDKPGRLGVGLVGRLEEPAIGDGDRTGGKE